MSAEELDNIKHLVFWTIKKFRIKLEKHYNSEDLLQDVRIHYFLNKKQWSSRYIVSITRWIAHNNTKKKEKKFERLLNIHTVEHRFDAIENAETCEKIRSSSLLTANERKVFDLMLQDMSDSDIARHENVSRQSINITRNRLLAKCRENAKSVVLPPRVVPNFADKCKKPRTSEKIADIWENCGQT